MPLLPSLGWFHRPPDHGNWIVEGAVLLTSYPSLDDLERYRGMGIRLVVNLHRRPHRLREMERLGLTELHLPVRDFTPPSLDQIERGVAAIRLAVDAGHGAVIHCGAGKGRGGTLAACYLVSQGFPVDQAIADVRARRPGAIETRGQERAIEAWSLLPGHTDDPSSP